MANILYLIPTALALIVAITIHEFSHALAADKLGDPTSRSMGRLTLNPLKHLDPIGTIALIFLGFGWGKPVPIDPYNLQHPKRDEAIISLAGPISNLILALIISLIVRFLPLNNISILFLSILVQMNVVLAIFNLLPLPPLDGSKIFLALLPQDKSIQWQEAFEKYGFVLIIVLLFLPIGGSNIISLIISPIIQTILRFLAF